MVWVTDNWDKVFAVASFLIGTWLTLRSWQRKRLNYLIVKSTLVHGYGSEDFEVKFKGYAPTIKSLTLIRVYLWNAGNRTIDKKDVPASSSLSIHCASEGVVLKAEIVKQTHEVNSFSVTKTNDRKSVTLKFAHLEPGHGCAINLYCTQSTNDPIEIKGIVREATINEVDHVSRWEYWCGICVGLLGTALLMSTFFSIEAVLKGLRSAWTAVLLFALGVFMSIVGEILKHQATSGRYLPKSIRP